MRKKARRASGAGALTGLCAVLLALFLVGDRHHSNRETLRRMGEVKRIFEVPRFEHVTPEILDEWLDTHAFAEVFDR